MYFYFFSLMLGFVPTLFIAFLLRHAAALLGRQNVAIWIVAGAIIPASLVAIVGGWARNAMAVPHSGTFPEALVSALAGGLVLASAEGWWLTVPAGAATAYILYRIDRAFAPQSSPSDQAATMAGGHS
jgi:hypothetical protein